MAYILKEGQGTLFPNKYKDTQNPNDRSPHFKGHICLNGKTMDIAGWWAWPQNGGEAYLQVKVTESWQSQQPQTPTGANAPAPVVAPQPQPQSGVQQYAQQVVNGLQQQAQSYDDLPF